MDQPAEEREALGRGHSGHSQDAGHLVFEPMPVLVHQGVMGVRDCGAVALGAGRLAMHIATPLLLLAIDQLPPGTAHVGRGHDAHLG